MTSTETTNTESQQIIPVILEEFNGISRQHEPVTVGIPFPKGMVTDLSDISLYDEQDHFVPCHTEILATWFDRSLKWVLFDFQAQLAAHEKKTYSIKVDKSVQPRDISGTPAIQLTQGSTSIEIDTGAAIFVLDTRVFKPFKEILVNGKNILDGSKSTMSLLDEEQQEYESSIRSVEIETESFLRTTIRLSGQLIGATQSPLANFAARLHFYANKSFCKIEYTIHNPNAAHHPGGLWDLGDPGSLYFKDLSLRVALSSPETPTVQWTAQAEQAPLKNSSESILLYQDSSGGEHWQSSNHVNRFGKVMHQFRGYRVTAGETRLEEGHRASPVMSIQNRETRLSATVYRFWENFPKALEAEGNTVTVRLFPKHYHDLFELQGGEQKTHTMFLSVCPLQNGTDSEKINDLAWVQSPLIPHASPEWYAQTRAFSYLTPHSNDPFPQVVNLINAAIEGEQSFVKRREIIDEYGWRNFGELYADHETAYYDGEGTPITHYNNQFDCIYNLLVQYVRSGNPSWFSLSHDLVHHVVDIDIYHTEGDKANYNGGLFWHTDHYVDVATATHRSYSRKTMERKNYAVYGGGQSNEHNYATGLMYHYYLTGEQASKEAALGLADWTIDMDDGRKTKFSRLNTRPTGYASITSTPGYHGPGRGSGNSVNTLLDGYLLSKNRAYLEKAEELIQRCIHPHDRIEERELDNSELRWSYTVFLQALGRYLDLKVTMNEYDYLFCYARESLLHYAKWMLEHEVTYLSVAETLEYPTETWPTQDLRKNNVLLFAAKYAQEPLREKLLKKAAYFFEKPLEELLSFETRTFTRPLILLMYNSRMPAYFHHFPDEVAPDTECRHDFGRPQTFKPQLYHVSKLRNFIYLLKEKAQNVKSALQFSQHSKSLDEHDSVDSDNAAESVERKEGAALKNTLFLTELYAPLHSGSANMFSNRFGLYPPEKVVVLTNTVEGSQDFDKSAAYPIHRIPLRWNGPKGFEWAGVVRDLVRYGFPLIRKHHIEVIQCARPLPEGIAGYLLAKLCFKKLVINSHGEDISVLQNYKAERLLMKLALRAAHLNLANSSFTESLIRNLGGTNVKTAVIHPGFNPKPLEIISPDKVSQMKERFGSGPLLVTVGRLQQRKGQDNVIRALPKVISQFPDLHYLIVGSAHGGTEDLKSQLERLAEELGVRQHVTLSGEISNEELLACYAACDLFLMPSRMEASGDAEGFGIVFLEAGYLEKPVIGGNSGGIPDAVRDGETGLLVDGQSVDQIADAIVKILSNAQLAKDMGTQGKTFALSMTHERIFERYYNVMTELEL